MGVRLNCLYVTATAWCVVCCVVLRVVCIGIFCSGGGVVWSVRVYGVWFVVLCRCVWWEFECVVIVVVVMVGVSSSE